MCTVASASRSWSENGIDVIEKIKDADELDWRFGLMLRMQLAFGLRRIEVLQIKPWRCDRTDKLCLSATKGGRPRDIYIDTGEQRVVLDMVKARLSKDEALGWKNRADGKPATLKYSTQRYSSLLPRIGISRSVSLVTGHGLRAQFAENAALVASMVPPTLGGSLGQMGTDELFVKRVQVSELLGHSRVSVTPSYYGTFGRGNAPDSPDQGRLVIEDSVKHLAAAAPDTMTRMRMADCLDMVRELGMKNIAITLPQVYILWAVHSQRHGVDWATPQMQNLAALEAAARHVLKMAGAFDKPNLDDLDGLVN